MQTARIGIGGKRVSMVIPPTPYHKFKTVMDELGWPSYVPNPRTDANALSKATKNKQGGRNRLIASKGGRGKKKPAGVDVVDVQRQQYSFNDYSPIMRAKVVGNNGSTQVVVEDSTDDATIGQELTDEFLRTKAILEGSAIKTKLKELMSARMHASHGLGGTYIPELDVPSWDRLAERLFGKYDASTGALVEHGICEDGEYEVTRVDLDQDSIRSIRKRLGEEIKARVKIIMEDLANKQLKADRIQNRVDESDQILDLIGVYEDELKLTMDDLREIAEDAKKQAGIAMMLEMASLGLGL